MNQKNKLVHGQYYFGSSSTAYYDVAVIGSGIAGLSVALKIAEKGRSVAIITKKGQAESNTNYAQGGIACVTSKSDDFTLHLRDTLKAGEGLCNEGVARAIITEGPIRIRELTEMGVPFSQLDDGRPSLGKEGGHSKRRILHVKDVTGRAIETALLQAVARHPHIEVLEHCFGIDVITTDKLSEATRKASVLKRVVGLYAFTVSTGRVITLTTGAVVLATGGVGQVYQYTTNPEIATGDGIAMAYRAGASIANMEFVQFHPTTLYSPDSTERFLISEAVRGEGAVLRNAEGEAFMKRYDPRGDLAPRDRVARAIDTEMKQSGARHLWLDVTHVSKAQLQSRFPNISATCTQRGINITSDCIPIVPAAHYLCGGILTNIHGQTDLKGLYACGETACTGLHGANRLASNSLLEAVVVAHRCAKAVDDYLSTPPPESSRLLPWKDGDVTDSDERVVLSHNWDELKRTLWDYVGIVRTTKRLERARTRIRNLSGEIHEYYWNFKVEPTLLELRNLIQVAEMIVDCALQRKESRGLHATLDYPQKRSKAYDSIVRRGFST